MTYCETALRALSGSSSITFTDTGCASNKVGGVRASGLVTLTYAHVGRVRSPFDVDILGQVHW